MRQDTSSPVEEATEWRTGVGIRGLEEKDDEGGFSAWRKVLVDSYVVKKAPAEAMM